MFKLLVITLFALFSLAAGKPRAVAPIAYTAGVATVPVTAAAAPVVYSAALSTPVVAATSSQYVARNYNGFVSPYVAAPYVAAPYASAYPYPYASATYVI